MTTTSLDRDPTRLARTAGALFVALAVLGPFSMLYVPGRIVVAGDAGATADNLRESGGLLRAAIAVDVVIMLIEVAMPVLLYLLFRPVGRGVALASAFARLGEAILIGVAMLMSLQALRLAGATGAMDAFDADQRDALALLALDGHEDGVFVGQLFFGFSLLLLGYLVHRAGFVPRIFGVLVLVASVGYLADGLGHLLWSGYEGSFGWLVGVTAVVGEVPFFLWLLIKGVDRQAWQARADGVPVARAGGVDDRGVAVR
jgi:hypothetical protein